MSEPPTGPTLLGNFVHEVLETMYKTVEPADRTLQTAKFLSAQIWPNWSDQIDEIIRNPDDRRQLRWQAWWCIENLFKMEDPTKVVLTGVETELNDTIGGVQIKGFIDRWINTGEAIDISDYKTGKTPRPQYRNDKFDQLLIYGIIVSAQTELPIGNLELLYLKDGTKLSKKPTDSDIARVTETVVSIRNGIDSRCISGDFEPVSGPLCNWCHYKPICPYWSKK